MQLIIDVEIVTRCPGHIQPCADVGESCANNADCFTNNCNEGNCAFTPERKRRSLDWRSMKFCTAVHGFCEHNIQCCTNNCYDGVVCDYNNASSRNGEKISPAEWESKKCSGVGKPCALDNECCTENCSAGACDY